MTAPGPFASWQPELAAVLLHGLRLLPVAIMSPFLGGPLVPALVRISLAFGLGASVWAAAGAAPFPGARWQLAAAAGGELGLGVALGLLASLPLEAARAGGRLADTLRGATLSELHVPLVRQRETALGDLLAQWGVVLAGSAGGDRLIVKALLSTFAAIPAGAGFLRQGALQVALQGSGEMIACALCIGAPAAAGILAADLALALAARAAPGLGLTGAAQPARAALGLFAMGAAASALAGKLTGMVALSAGLVDALGRAGARP